MSVDLIAGKLVIERAVLGCHLEHGHFYSPIVGVSIHVGGFLPHGVAGRFAFVALPAGVLRLEGVLLVLHELAVAGVAFRRFAATVGRLFSSHS
jgi:hypothetical protein